jgi:hypothetical protein
LNYVGGCGGWGCSCTGVIKARGASKYKIPNQIENAEKISLSERIEDRLHLSLTTWAISKSIFWFLAMSTVLFYTVICEKHRCREIRMSTEQ